MDFEIVLACDSRWGVGVSTREFTIPWKIKEDISFFRNTTRKVDLQSCDEKSSNKVNAIIMGRITAETFNKPLPYRLNVIITSRNDYRKDEGFVSYKSLDEALTQLAMNENVHKAFVIGGAILANEAVLHKRCRAINLNIVNHDYDCDVKLSKEFMDRFHSSVYDKSIYTTTTLCSNLNLNVEFTFNTHTFIKKDFEIILACDSKGGIGISTNKFTIPWKIKEDMIFFRNITQVRSCSEPNKVNAIIMGRITADTFKKPLPNRLNIIITSKENYRKGEGFVSYRSLNEAIARLEMNEEVHKIFVIGGAVLANQAIMNKRCRIINLNIINHDYECDIKLSQEFMDKFHSDTYNKTSNRITTLCSNLNSNVELSFNTHIYENREEMRYLNLIEGILTKGEYRGTRNSCTYKRFGKKLKFDLANGIPLLTTKQMFDRGVGEECNFMCSGYTDAKILKAKGVPIWNGNTTGEYMVKHNEKLEKLGYDKLEEYDMGPVYGYQWRHFGAPYRGCNADYTDQGIDQLRLLVDEIVTDPHSRRMLLTTYDPTKVEQGVLPPCHGLMIQFSIEKLKRRKDEQGRKINEEFKEEDPEEAKRHPRRLSLQMYQRSADVFLGLPFNITFYARMIYRILALVNNSPKKTHQIDIIPGRVIMLLGDVHAYKHPKADHITAIKTQLKRKYATYPFPKYRLKKKLVDVNDLKDLKYEDEEIIDYVCHGPIKAAMVA